MMVREKILGRDVIQTEGQNKIKFFTPYSLPVHLTRALKCSDHSLCFISQHSKFHYTKNIANGQFNWFHLRQVFTFYTARSHITIFPYPHTHLYYTFQFVISISQINNTVSRGRLRAIQCVMQ